MTVRLTILSVLQVLVFAGALIAFLRRIVAGLEPIGGSPSSSLAKLSFGVRAIEKETSPLGPQVMQLNQGLVALGGKLAVVDTHLGTVAEQLAAGKGAG